MIERVTFQRFKQFRERRIDLAPEGVSLIAGGNNAGKSSLLHGLAVWEFCRTAIEMERGIDAFLPGAGGQGLGLGDDEFSPIAVPSLKHLWTNLKTQRGDGDPDGYTLRIRCQWEQGTAGRHLEFGLALANDRLFVKVTDSNLERGDRVPRIAYLPPFAGITDREMRVSGAIRRRRIGEGLAGAVLRNLLLDMHQANEQERLRLRGDKSKISDSDLRKLRAADPWELLQSTLRERFSAELIVAPFREEYHSYIRVDVDKGEVNGFKLKRYPGYNKRDLMVEGSGFLQWLSVYALATARDVDVLLLDEPDAHLHPTLQSQLLESLRLLADATGKQVMVATHSSELLRNSPAERILEVRSGGSRARYLKSDDQKVGLLVGLGSDYAPRLDPIRRTRRVVFVEGSSDIGVLTIIARKLGVDFPDELPIWHTTAHHKERRQIFRALLDDMPGLRAVSLRDRDDESASTVNVDLDDLALPGDAQFLTMKWRRRYIESYLLHPHAIARALGVTEDVVRQRMADAHALAVGDTFTDSACPPALLDARGKEVLSEGSTALLSGTGISLYDVAAELTDDEICDDLKTFFARVSEWCSPPG